MDIKAKHEDKIYPIREFICRLGRVQDEQFKLLHSELVADGFPDDESTTNWLFDYCFNSDVDKEVVSFEEYCDCEFMQEYRARKHSDFIKSLIGEEDGINHTRGPAFESTAATAKLHHTASEVEANGLPAPVKEGEK
jgi:hypothetical protein